MGNLKVEKNAEVLKNENNLIDKYKMQYSLIDIEEIGEKFEQDARRYKRYLGDDSRAVFV
ncbi:MAG: hypothetical protein RUMPE_00874 [Eubacteriales bacterium SKADARSKE-1]|nr:hypothetical protein [Eubacteriales bacterium SKADARSKE-1]